MRMIIKYLSHAAFYVLEIWAIQRVFYNAGMSNMFFQNQNEVKGGFNLNARLGKT